MSAPCRPFWLPAAWGPRMLMTDDVAHRLFHPAITRTTRTTRNDPCKIAFNPPAWLAGKIALVGSAVPDGSECGERRSGAGLVNNRADGDRAECRTGHGGPGHGSRVARRTLRCSGDVHPGRPGGEIRSEERRVGKECRTRTKQHHQKKRI